MASRRLAVAEAKREIYRAACIAAGSLLSKVRGAGWQRVEEARKVLAKATHDAAKIDSWVTIKQVHYGALFEVQSGLRYIKTIARGTNFAICIDLATGMRHRLSVDMLVRVLTVKEGSHGSV